MFELKPRDIAKCLQLLQNGEFYSIHEPRFKKEDEDTVIACIRSTFVSYVSDFVKIFESELSQYLGAKHVVAMSSGTAALHMSLVGAEIPHDSEILLPSLTFVATANAIKYVGAHPHFIDSNTDDPNIDVGYLREYLLHILTIKNGQTINKKTGRAVSAIIAVHIFGHPVEMTELKKIADEYNLILIEDAAQALGSIYKDDKCSVIGDIGTLSFNGNKILTTGGGGAVITNNEKYAQRIRHLSTTAKIPHKWDFIHDSIAYNLRLPGINAALGINQIRRLEETIAFKRTLSQYYQNSFKDFKGLTILHEPRFCRSNYWLNAILLDANCKTSIQEILSCLHENGIFARPLWMPLHQLDIYRDAPRATMHNAERLYQRIINLPSSPFLAEGLS